MWRAIHLVCAESRSFEGEPDVANVTNGQFDGLIDEVTLFHVSIDAESVGLRSN